MKTYRRRIELEGKKAYSHNRKTPKFEFFCIFHRWYKKCANHCDRNEVTFALSVRHTASTRRALGRAEIRSAIKYRISGHRNFTQHTFFLLFEPPFSNLSCHTTYKEHHFLNRVCRTLVCNF